MKRVISFTLALLLIWGLMGGLVPTASAASWAEPYLQNLVRRSVMQGDKTGNLYAHRMITRAEFAALLNRAFGFNHQGKTKFKDVPTTAWYASDISIAADQGYMQGDGKGANPGGNLTREQAATMLCRALKIAPSEGEGFNLIDERKFSNWSRGYINASVDKRFVSGYPDGGFRPTNNITRGEAAKMLSEVAGEIVSATTNRANGVISGNVTIASSEVTLSNVTILGDLYITEGVGLGYVKLRNVSVNGEMIISGAGESNIGQSSVILTDCNISNLTVDVAKRKILTLKTDRTTSVKNSLIKSSTYLEELSSNYEGFDRVIMNGPSGSFLNLTGNFADVRLISEGATLGLYKGEADSITVDETAKDAKIFLEKDTYTNAMYFDTGATMTGTGIIDSVLINNDKVTIAQLPNNIYIRPGVQAKINGKVMGSLDAEMDGFDPDFLYGYPKTDQIKPASFTEYFMTNKPGKVYYATYNLGMPAPSAEELIAKNGAPKNAIKFGKMSSLPDKEISAAVSGLKPGKEYVVYSLFVDLREEKSHIEKNYVETVDNILPTLLSGYPKLSGTDRDKALITLIPNKNTSYYWAALPSGTVAPTAEQLYAQNVSGALAKGVTRDGIMNTPKDIDTSIGGTLQESVPYVFYVMLRDSAGNMSKRPYKIAFTTKDLTAPAFQPEDIYPKVALVTAKAIPIEYMVDEPCTLYWSAAKRGSNVLQTLPNGTLDFTSQKSKDIVKGGTGGDKYGKSSAGKSATKYKVSISGLEQQMPYDIYFMLEDKHGNQSEIKMLMAKTKDVIPPTASISCAQVIASHFSVDSPISLSFSEIVCGAQIDAAGDYVRLAEMFALDKNVLNNYIKLIDTSQVPETQVSIDWSKVSVRDADVKTVLTFEVGAIPLSNNNAYRFDLAYRPGFMIRDTSKNELKARTGLPFQTVPPLTYFSEVKSIDSDQYDTAFLIRPDANKTGKYIYFDILLSAATPIEFELYSGTDINNLTKEPGTHVLLVDYATSFREFFGKPIAYKDMVDTYYAIKLTKVEETVITSGEVPITANVDLTMHAVIGNLAKISALRGPAEKLEEKLNRAVSKGDVSSVTAPNDPFELRITLIDNVPPSLTKDQFDQFIKPKFTAGDTQALMKVKTTKGCTLYYYAIPTSEDPVKPSAYLIRTARSEPARGIAAGSFQVPDDTTVGTEYTIEGLQAPIPPDGGKPYVIYYYLQGDAPSPSGVYTDTFSTIPVAAPMLVNKLQYKAGGGMVTVSGSWDSDCTMYYVVYPADLYSKATIPVAAEIINSPNPTQVIAQGSVPVKARTKFEVKAEGLEYTRRYDIFVVAQKYIGTAPAGDPSVVAFHEEMAPLDNCKPEVSTGSPNTSTKYDATSNTLIGSVEVNFTEGLYYFEQNLSIANPLTETQLATNLIFMPADGKIKLEKTTSTGIEGCINYIQFSFDTINDGTTISFKSIGDKALNMSGDFKMTFHAGVDADGNPTGEWTAQFISAD